MPRMHRRELIVREAKLALDSAIIEWQRSLPDDEESELTDAEYLQILIGSLDSFMQSRLKYIIRYERHGDTDTPGGWE